MTAGSDFKWPEGATGYAMREVDGEMVQEIYENGVMVKRIAAPVIHYSAEAVSEASEWASSRFTTQEARHDER